MQNVCPHVMTPSGPVAFKKGPRIEWHFKHKNPPSSKALNGVVVIISWSVPFPGLFGFEDFAKNKGQNYDH